jgi:hypothetical protein
MTLSIAAAHGSFLLSRRYRSVSVHLTAKMPGLENVLRIIQTIVFSFFFTVCAIAKDDPRFEAFAGFSVYNGKSQSRNTFLGGQFNLKFSFNPKAAFVFDAGGQYRSDPAYTPPPGLSFFNFHERYIHAYQALIGPEFTRRNENADVFFHVLPGMVHGFGDFRLGTNFGALGLGGGYVLHRQKLFGLRLQLDYIPNHGNGHTYHDIRFGIGPVWRKK